MLQQLLDPSLVGTLQHRWKRKEKNIIPKIAWSQFRHMFSPGFEDLLEMGSHSGWYDPGILLQKYK